QTQHLVDALLVELEWERLRPRHDPQRSDLELDLAGREVRVDGLRRARDHLAFGLEHELVADVMRTGRCLGRGLRVDHELELAGVVAQVDEDEPTVVAPRVRPPRDRQVTADVARANFATEDVAPTQSRRSFSSGRSTATSSSPGLRSIIPSSP